MNKIVSVRCFECGSEEFDFSELFTNSRYKTEKLPINVLHIEHKKFGNILINTGCTECLKKNLTKYTKYKTVHKLSFSKKDSIIYQLEKEDTDPLCIKKVLLTHCAPECCGALPLLPKYEIVSSAQVLCAVKLGISDDLILKGTMPSPEVPIKAVNVYNRIFWLDDYFKFVYDILGDGSVLGVDLRGHYSEMMGFYLPEYKLFYAADAAIDERVITEDLDPSEKLLEQQTYSDDYLSAISTLKRIHKEQPDVQIMFLHSKKENFKVFD